MEGGGDEERDGGRGEERSGIEGVGGWGEGWREWGGGERRRGRGAIRPTSRSGLRTGAFINLFPLPISSVKLAKKLAEPITDCNRRFLGFSLFIWSFC